MKDELIENNKEKEKKVSEEQPTEKVLEEQPTEKVLEEQPTEKVSEEQLTEKVSEEQSTIKIDEKFIRQYSTNLEVIKYIQSKFNDNLRRVGAIYLIRLLLREQLPINITDFLGKKHARFYQYNKGWFDEDKNLKFDKHKALYRDVLMLVQLIGKDLQLYDKKKHLSFNVKMIKGVQHFVLDKHSLLGKVDEVFCDEGGEAEFYYDFNKPDMELQMPTHIDTLQRCKIQILGSIGLKFDHDVEYTYVCPRCGKQTIKKPYEVDSTNKKMFCEGIWIYRLNDNEPKSRICGMPLIPHSNKSLTKGAYYYDINYDNEEGKQRIARAYSFHEYSPGFYDCVLFKIQVNDKIELFYIVDTKEIESKKFVLPEKIEGENYIFTLQRNIDDYIEQQTGIKMWGLYPIKCALILQKAFDLNAKTLLGNIQIVGDTATGKSMILKYYGYLLNPYKHLSTNGLSISIPGLRGTRATITLFNKDIKIITSGHLGSYKTIHIDEAGENPVLVKNMKTFLAETNYSYDKAGSDGTVRKRSAQINLSENLSFTHIGQYRGTIRKYYREMKDTTQIGNYQQEEWDEEWDLFLPQYKYIDNPYLHKAIKDKRLEYKQKQQFWVDGYDYALHERFPFYFYLVNEKECDELDDAVRINSSRNIIEETFDLMKALNTQDLENFFLSLEYKPNEKDIKMFEGVDRILKSYGIHADSRIKKMFNIIAKLSATINKRQEINEEDLFLIKWFVENTNCKIDVADTATYTIEGAPDLGEAEKKGQEIEDSTKIKEDMFGLPPGEF